jgi:hypothetical protein
MLQAASFLSHEVSLELAAVAAFAPNLEQLGCRRLEITPAPAAAAIPAAAAAAAGLPDPPDAAMNYAQQQQQQQGFAAEPQAPAAAVALLKLTHFGGQAVTVPAANSPAEAAAAFGAALPSLRVMYRVPQVSGGQGKEAGYDELLAQLPLLTEVRGRNWFSSRSWFLIRSSGHLASEVRAAYSR